MVSINTPSKQSGSNYLKQVGRVLKSKAYDEEKIWEMSSLTPPDDSSINAKWVEMTVARANSSKNRPKGLVMSALIDIEQAISEYNEGYPYRAEFVWTAHYTGTQTTRTHRKTLTTFPTLELHNKLEQEAINHFPEYDSKLKAHLERISGDFYIVRADHRPVLMAPNEDIRKK